MFGKRIELFKLLGFSVHIDFSWLIVATLIAWSLAAGVFPDRLAGLSDRTYWIMGVIAMLGLFASIIVHELAHSIVARRFDIPITGITLFVFGGVAHMDEEPRHGRDELLMAIAGPVASLLLAAICLGIGSAGDELGWPVEITGIIGYLGWINMIVAGFNLLPAFPLDGGRVLRATLWSWKGDLRWATRISSLVGSSFGLALILVGLLTFIGGHVLGGLWWFLIGMFLRSAAQQSYKQALIHRVLDDVPLQRIMRSRPVVVTPDITVQSLVDDYMYVHHHKMFPVVDDGRLVGCVTSRHVQRVGRDEWSKLRVEDILEPCSPENTIGIDEGAARALTKLKHGEGSRLMVVEDQRIVGVLTLRDLMRYLTLNTEVE